MWALSNSWRKTKSQTWSFSSSTKLGGRWRAVSCGGRWLGWASGILWRLDWVGSVLRRMTSVGWPPMTTWLGRRPPSATGLQIATSGSQRGPEARRWASPRCRRPDVLPNIATPSSSQPLGPKLTRVCLTPCGTGFLGLLSPHWAKWVHYWVLCWKLLPITTMDHRDSILGLPFVVGDSLRSF
jgi:hypothetical protein